METFIKYAGGKTREIPLIEKFLPKKINRFFEAFVGGGSIFLWLENEKSFINDKSIELYNLYTLLKEQNVKLKQLLLNFNGLWIKVETNVSEKDFKSSLFSYAKYEEYYKKSLELKNKTFKRFLDKGLIISSSDKEKAILTAKKTAVYMLIRDKYNTTKDKIEKTACFYFLREYCYSSISGNFNVPYGASSYNFKYLDKKINYMFSEELNNLLIKTQIYNLDFEDFFNSFEYNENDFIFLDPPYDSEFSTYDKNVFGREEQIRLCNNLKKIKAKWMLVIKKTDFIYNLYKDFNIYEYDKKYSVSFKNRNNKEAKHLLITNYEVK